MELGNAFFGNSRGEFSIPRFVGYEDQLNRLLAAFEAVLSPLGRVTLSEEFENEVFSVKPYYWGDDEAEANKPNFHFKPSGYELKWYKYPLRDSYQSIELSVEDFGKMIDKCVESLSVPK